MAYTLQSLVLLVSDTAKTCCSLTEILLPLKIKSTFFCFWEIFPGNYWIYWFQSKIKCQPTNNYRFKNHLNIFELVFLDFPRRSCIPVLEDFWCRIHFLLQNFEKCASEWLQRGSFKKIFNALFKKIYAFSIQHTKLLGNCFRHSIQQTLFWMSSDIWWF